MLSVWPETYWISRNFSQTRYRGTGATVIQTDDQMLVAQQADNLRRILLSARKAHSRRDYARMSEPILLELRQREQEILEYPTRDIEQPVANRDLHAWLASPGQPGGV